MRRSRRSRGYGAKLVLVALIVVATGAGGFALLSDRRDSAPVSGASETARVPHLPDTVELVRPALKATIPEGVTAESLEAVRAVPGVAAAARVLLATLRVEAPDGDTDISVAAVTPEEFRPLAPELTAQTRFVWEGLYRSQAFIANEEYQILGGRPIQTLAARGPSGRRALTIGGVAANGLPSLAGVLMSMELAGDLGLGDPTLVLVGLEEGATIAAVTGALADLLPGVGFDNILPPSGRTFYSGAAAERAIGSFTYTINDDGSIVQDPRWVREHLAGEQMPIIGHVRCHKVMLPQLRMALEEIERSGMAHLLKPEQTGRCFQPRFVERDPSRQLSKHAWGLAIDLNVYDNPEGSTPRMDPRIVAVFEKWGFRWGGRWTIPDGMHFELAALLSE